MKLVDSGIVDVKSGRHEAFMFPSSGGILGLCDKERGRIGHCVETGPGRRQGEEHEARVRTRLLDKDEESVFGSKF